MHDHMLIIPAVRGTAAAASWKIGSLLSVFCCLGCEEETMADEQSYSIGLNWINFCSIQALLLLFISHPLRGAIWLTQQLENLASGCTFGSYRAFLHPIFHSQHIPHLRSHLVQPSLTHFSDLLSSLRSSHWLDEEHWRGDTNSDALNTILLPNAQPSEESSPKGVSQNSQIGSTSL